MHEARPSRTAQEVAFYRAAHQLLDRPLIFDDPMALRIIGPIAEKALRSNPRRFNASPEVRAFLALRSRYTEEALAKAVARGVGQFVILGAGLDTFAYRNPHPGLRVFEVDHPSTQAWKRDRLAEVGITIPHSLTFVPIDFTRETLGEGLARAGFDRNQPAMFSMLGLVIFLPKLIVMQTLEFVASCPSPSGIVLDYGILPSSLSPEQLNIRMIAAKHTAELGEPFVTFLDPAEFAADLKRLGFTHIEDLGPHETNTRYFASRTDGLTVGITGRRLVSAAT